MEEILKRTRLGLVIVLVLSLTITYIGIFMPLSNALRESALENYELLSEAKYQVVYNQVERSIEGSMSLSSRTMIREMIYTYKQNDATRQEMVDYIAPKYHDGVEALQRVIYAMRVVDNEAITIEGELSNPEEKIEDHKDDYQLNYKLDLSTDKMLVEVFSPIMKGDKFLGYDLIGYCLDECVEELGNEDIQVHVDSTFDFSLAEPIINDLYHHDDKVIFVKEVFEGAFFIAEIDANTLYEDGDMTAFNGMVRVIVATFALFLVIEFIILRHARNIISSTESTRDHYMEKANTDELTGVFSRQYFNHWVQDCCDDSKPCSVVMMDVDDFKSVNDNYGHLVGDEVLKLIANTLKDSIRDNDLVVRYGGDEFLLILSTNKYEEVIHIMDRVDDQLDKIDQYPFEVSISYGVDVVDYKEDFNEYIKRADRKMYDNKKSKKHL